ncbi:MAG: ADP-glyceromanno-heptose 6-epimerase [Luteolibacter sp.]
MQPTDKILITGAAGFIGSALVHELNQRGFENLLLADVLGSDEKWKNLVPLKFADYLDAADLYAALADHNDINTIFHLGACSATTERDASYLMENNTRYTKRLCEWALAGDRRFVYASSAATYGDGSRGMNDGIDALETLRPLNMYGYSKHLFDLYAKRNGWFDRIVGLKYFNIFGPNEDHKGDMRSVVHKSYAKIRDEDHVTLFRSHQPDYRDGEQQRDFLYVKDAVDATLHLAAHPTASGLFNIGSGNASTWIELVTPMFAAMEKSEDIRFIDMPEHLRGKYQYHTCADIARLKATGWNGPNFTLAAAVTDYVKNHLIPDRRLGE